MDAVDWSKPRLGQLVIALKGRDAGKPAVIVSIEEDRYVRIADGDKRKFDQAKKKNVIHLKLKNHIADEVAASLRENGRVTNGKLRFAVNKYMESEPLDAAQKGD